MQTYFLILTIILGLCVGSFLNVVIYRLPNNMSIAKPASHCPNCNYVLKWYDNIPVLSYIMLGGKCRSCKKKISPRYTMVEILNCLLWIICYLLFKENIVDAIAKMLLSSTLLCIFFIDIEHKIIPDSLVITSLIIAIFSLFNGENITDRLIGFVGSTAVYVSVYYLCILLLKKEGMGFGDVKLLAVLGLFTGWQLAILTIFLSAVLASIILGIISLATKKGAGYEFPFAPFIVTATIISILVGNQIINFYLNLFI